MQTRKLSVKAFYDLPLAEGLRVLFVVHTPTELKTALYLSFDRRSLSSKTVP